ncbi:RNA polymerase subunit sigma [Roseateles aquatilis]|uniref:RNA polymerase sigma factor n=1 Tax=Roseateles aquatilis TaxID=431061 RepID=A0A246IW17_9BURK|nr:sigma-70 family RNA polymerase sigma factor [Roseateles aquatilis]OWQ84428.1 RNA polymerase subunit sigma [Roseateles aquatilis]
MGTPRRDDPATAPANGPGGATPPASLGKRHLTIVPFDPDRSAAPPPEDWSAALCLVAERSDREAFGRLFSHFAPRVKSYLMRTGSSDALAEELAQEALVTVWRKAALFDPAQAAVSTWIFTIARHLRVDAARRHRLDGAGDECFEFDDLAADQPDAAQRIDATRLAQRVREALRRLPPEQAQVLRLSFYDDEPHARIAAELDLPLGTVKSRIRLAMAHLRRLLDP